MREALWEGQADAAQIASFAKARAKKKTPDRIAAREEHRRTDHHRRMIRFRLEQMRFLEEQLAEIDEPIWQQIPAAGYTKPGELLRSLPAVQENAACWRKWDQPPHSFLMKSTSPPGAAVSGQPPPCRA
jgi:hypothetical protein